jgi:hypothetical protein
VDVSAGLVMVGAVAVLVVAMEVSVRHGLPLPYALTPWFAKRPLRTPKP